MANALHCDNQKKRCLNEGIMYLVGKGSVQRPLCRECAGAYYRRGTPIFLARPIAESRERIIDGCEPQRVRLFAPAIVGLQPCEPGKHCAAHCEAPYPCCRCGAEFVELVIS